MTTISLEEIQHDPVGYLRRAAAGEPLLIVQDKKPFAVITPAPHTVEAQPLRPVGLCAGEFVVPDDFEAPLPDKVLNAFDGR